MSGLFCTTSRCAWRTVGRAPILTSRSIWLSCAAQARPTNLRRQTQQCTRTRNSGSVRGIFFAPKVVKDYEELPREYRDQIGLSFGRELSDKQAADIFGADDTSAVRANHLLRILHGRRVAGTLEDPAFAIHTAQYDEGEIALALAYLRRTVPVEEVRNAGLRAEDELEQMEQDMQQNAKKDGENKQEEEEEAVYKPDPRYGPSRLDEMRARNVARAKAREKALQEDKAAGKEEVLKGPLAVRRREDGSREITNPRIKEYYEKAQSDLDAPPEMKAWERILPSATVVFLVLGFMAAVAAVYEEPAPRYRLLREVSTAQATVGAVIAANALAFIGWRCPPLWALFNRYMILVVATVRPATLFTAVFSHTRLSHLLVNMVPLWFVGTSLHEEMSRADFLALYLGCGSVGFLGGLATYALRGWTTVTSLGASGATLGLCAAYFWEHRDDRFRILGLPEGGVHGIVFLAGLTAVQLAGLGKTVKLKVDIASHLAGIAAGIAGIELLNRTERRRASRSPPRTGDEA